MRKSRRKPFIAIDAGVILLAILFFVTDLGKEKKAVQIASSRRKK